MPSPVEPPSDPDPLSWRELLGDPALPTTSRTHGQGPAGRLPVTDEMLRELPSGDLFGLTQNAGMGWKAAEIGRDPYLIISTQGGLKGPQGEPVALGYHTGHWDIDLLVRRAALTLREAGALPFAAACSDPCDGRTQGTAGMFDSLPYRNDAAMVMRRLIRSLPTRRGVLAVATCDKGLPAAMLALAGCGSLPGLIVPGGVTLPVRGAEDAGAVQTIGARFAHGLIDRDYAAEMGCRACGSTGGGCQFLGTAASSQVVAEALGIALPHSALMPSGEPVWLDLAHRSALALLRLQRLGLTLSQILTPAAVENAMLVHAAFGGSTNLLLHLPAIARAAGLPAPSVDDWIRVNKATPRLVDALPNGPRHHPTVQVHLAGGVPEVMLHLRQLGLLRLDALTATGRPLGEMLDWWADSDWRRNSRQHLRDRDQIDPDQVIMDPDRARAGGLSSTVVFPTGNLAPEGSVIKATAIDPSLIDEDNVYRHRGSARVFTSEREAIRAIKGQSEPPLQAGNVIVLIGVGPSGTGMEETYQLTSALKFLPWGKHVPILTDARFSGVSTGACIGHVSPEALAGGPIGRVRDGDWIEIVLDRAALSGSVEWLGARPSSQEGADWRSDAGRDLGTETAASTQAELMARPPHPQLAPAPGLPDDTRLWARLQAVSGGPWGGCVYDVDRIIEVLDAGERALKERAGGQAHGGSCLDRPLRPRESGEAM